MTLNDVLNTAKPERLAEGHVQTCTEVLLNEHPNNAKTMRQEGITISRC